jgi:hypothetical protein
MHAGAVLVATGRVPVATGRALCAAASGQFLSSFTDALSPRVQGSPLVAS